MALESPDTVLDYLVNRTSAPPECRISLMEAPTLDESEVNWAAASGNMTLQALSRYNDALLDMRRRYPRIDWSYVAAPPDGSRKLITR